MPPCSQSIKVITIIIMLIVAAATTVPGLPLFPLPLSSPATHIESGSARGFFQLIREFFLSKVTKVLAHCGNYFLGLDLLCKVP